MNHRQSQYDKILEWLQQGHKLTPLDALHNFGCLRLGARIWEMKKNGISVQTELVKLPSGKHVARYWL